MEQKVKLDKFGKVVMDYLKDYIEDIEQGVVETTDEVTNEAIIELKSISPEGRGKRDKPYRKGWSKQRGKSALNNHRYTIKIHNKTNYQLTHLLELGHATVNGKRTKAIPHIRPTEQKYNKVYEAKLSTCIRRRSN